MLGSWGFRFLVVFLLLASFLLATYSIQSSGIQQTGAVVGEEIGREFDNTPVFTCPENKCPGDEEIDDCREVLDTYEERAAEMEREKEILMQRIRLFLEEGCTTGNGKRSMEDIKGIVDPESVRDLAVFVISSSSKDPVTSLYNYVRKNIMFVDDPEDEYIASPCETVLAGGGDCEDHAILLASMLKAVGVESKIIWIPEEHTLVGIAGEGEEIVGMCDKFLHFDDDGGNVIVADTTFSNCIGMISEDYVDFEGNEWDWKKKPVIFDV